jgi:hypothetical protein
MSDEERDGVKREEEEKERKLTWRARVNTVRAATRRKTVSQRRLGSNTETKKGTYRMRD